MLCFVGPNFILFTLLLLNMGFHQNEIIKDFVLEILIKTLRKFQEYVQNNNKNVIALDLFEKYQEGRLITSNQK